MPQPNGDEPALLERYVLHNQNLDLLSFFATLGAPTDIHAASLRVNLLFPADEETDHWLRALDGNKPVAMSSIKSASRPLP